MILTTLGCIVAAWTLYSIGSGVVQFFSKGDCKFPSRHLPTAAATTLLIFSLPIILVITKIQTIRGKNV